MRLSVVVPCFNEESGLAQLCASLLEYAPVAADDFEILLVDDGSRDGTLSVMRCLADSNAQIRYVSLSRNFGKEAAMLAGLQRASGDAVAIMDADLQHPPSLLPRMVRALEGGYDQVVARRTRTGDPLIRTVASRLYYWMLNRMSEVRIVDGAGDFRVLSRRAVDALLSLSEFNRFSKGLFAWIGFRTATVDYVNVQRADGCSTWSFGKLINYGIDGIVSFNNRPLRAAIYVGAAVTALAFVYAMTVVIKSLVAGVDVPGYVTLMVGIVGMGGLQLLLLGVLGEYLGRIYYETKRRPHFVVQETSDRPAGLPRQAGHERIGLIESERVETA